MKKRLLLKAGCLFAILAIAGTIASAQPVTMQNLGLSTNGNFQFEISGPTNVAYYKVYSTNDITASLSTWPLVAVGGPGQTSFSLPMQSTNCAFYCVTTNYYDTNNPIPLTILEVTQAIATKPGKNGPDLIDPSSIPSMQFLNNFVLYENNLVLRNDAYALTLVAQIAGDFTNNYTFKWSLLFNSEPYSDAGITGYHTPSLRIVTNSMITSVANYIIILTVTRLADGYQCFYQFTNVSVQGSTVTEEQEYINCLGQTNACSTCPCQYANLLPATDN
jgi:hypothetical protein